MHCQRLEGDIFSDLLTVICSQCLLWKMHSEIKHFVTLLPKESSNGLETVPGKAMD